ncbi:unnamed protein product, partial [marine sediment metagenome]
ITGTLTVTEDIYARSYYGNVSDATIGYNGETVKEIFEDTINTGVLDSITIGKTGGLGYNWSIGEIYDQTNKQIIETVTGATDCADNSIEYLLWVSGNNLTPSAVRADLPSGEIDVGHVHCQNGTILEDPHEESIINEREYSLHDAQEEIFPIIITSGLVLSENTEATYAWDIKSTAGVYFQCSNCI